MSQTRARALYDAAEEATTGKRRVRLTLLGNVESALGHPDEYIVWLYVGPGKPEPGAMTLGDLREFLK